MKEVVFEKVREEINEEIVKSVEKINKMKEEKGDTEIPIEDLIIDEVEIVMDVFNKRIEELKDSTSKIYYFVDKYFLKQKENSNEWVTHELYVDIESEEMLLIPIDECTLFERENIVLDSLLGYQFLRNKFILNQYKSDEKTSVNKMVKKYRKKIK